MNAIRLWLALALLGVVVAPVGAKKWDPKTERQIGEQVCAEVDKQLKRWDNPEALKKIQQILAALVPHTQRPDVQYDVRLADSDEVNAFSIPGGFMYVTKGLLQSVQSDDELAGVLAHEIAHNCAYDALREAERSQKLFMGALGTALLTVLLGAPSEVTATTAQAGLYVRQALLSRFSIDVEARADANAVRYLLKSGYNPVGLLTFMERLAREERRKMPPDLGVFETHPLSRVRVSALIDQLTAAGVKINRRAVMNWRKPEVKQVEAAGGQWPAVTWWDQTIFTVVGPEAAQAKARAESICQALTQVLAEGAMLADFTLEGHGEEIVLLGAGRPILTVCPADAQAQKSQVRALAEEALRAVRRALTQERLAYEF
jgi:Zn-dependent protease with chaperone function